MFLRKLDEKKNERNLQTEQPKEVLMGMAFRVGMMLVAVGGVIFSLFNRQIFGIVPSLDLMPQAVIGPLLLILAFASFGILFVHRNAFAALFTLTLCVIDICYGGYLTIFAVQPVHDYLVQRGALPNEIVIFAPLNATKTLQMVVLFCANVLPFLRFVPSERRVYGITQ